MDDLRILVVGAGAVGGYFGGRLAQAGRDVTFLVREHRAQQLRETGLVIESPHGRATIDAQTASVEQLEPFDLILLAVKTYGLDRAVQDIRAAVGERTAILPVLNGMRHIDVLTAAFGASHVLGGVCIVSTTLDERGRIVQLNELQELTYGELDGTRSPRIDAIDAAMQEAAFAARASSHILLEMWEKWVFIAALGAATCLLRGSTSEILAAPRGRDLILRILDECIAVASASGYAPRAPSLERAKAVLTNPQAAMTSSMFRDLRKGAPLEADAILGDLCARGEALQLSLPLTEAAFAQLAIYGAERLNADGALQLTR